MLKFVSNPYGSGLIRAKQVAELLGAPCDVQNDPGDIVVVVKGLIFDAPIILDKGLHIWSDVVDGFGCITQLFVNPRMKAIAMGDLSAQFIRRRVTNELRIIPEHHCNFENVHRKERDVKVVGAICNPGNFDLDPELVRKALADVGLEFKIQTEFTSRQSVIDFYKSIDIQLCVRYWRGIGQKEPPELKNPLKLSNAGSFKIPTVSFPEPCFMEDFGEDTFVPVYGIGGIVEKCLELSKNKRMYDDYANKAHDRARCFHVSRILPLYKELD